MVPAFTGSARGYMPPLNPLFMKQSWEDPFPNQFRRFWPIYIPTTGIAKFTRSEVRSCDVVAASLRYAPWILRYYFYLAEAEVERATPT